MIYTVTFNPAIDYVVQLEHLTQGTVTGPAMRPVYCRRQGDQRLHGADEPGHRKCGAGLFGGLHRRAVENALQRKGLRTDFIRLQNGMTRINVKIRGACETEINGKGPDIGPAALALL